jgi:hypothetical protein
MSNLYIINGVPKKTNPVSFNYGYGIPVNNSPNIHLHTNQKDIGYTLEGLKTAMKYFADNIFSDWYNEYYNCRSLLKSWDDKTYNSAYPNGTGGIKYLKDKNQLIHNTAIFDFFHDRSSADGRGTKIDENYNHLKYMCDKFQNWQKDNNCNWDDTAFQVFYTASNGLDIASSIVSKQYVNAGKTTVNALANALDLKKLHRTFIWLNNFLNNFRDNQDEIKTMFYSANDMDKPFPPSLTKYPMSSQSSKPNLPDEFGNVTNNGNSGGNNKAPAPTPPTAPAKQSNSSGALLGLGTIYLISKFL